MAVRLDHLVLWVADPLASVTFYERALGFTGVRVDEFRERRAPFPFLNALPGAAFYFTDPDGNVLEARHY